MTSASINFLGEKSSDNIGRTYQEECSSRKPITQKKGKKLKSFCIKVAR